MATFVCSYSDGTHLDRCMETGNEVDFDDRILDGVRVWNFFDC